MSKKNKILVYNNILFSVSQTFIYEQVLCLNDKFDVHLIAKEFENPHGFDIDLFKKIKINRPNNLIGRVAGKALRMLNKTNLDINFSSFFKLRKFMKANDYKAIHAHFGHRALEILGFAKSFNIPLVVSFHGYDASQLLNDKSYVDKLPFLFEYASAIIISGRHMSDNLKLNKWSNKIHLIPYGINTDDFEYVSENKKSKKIKILHSGRIVGKKGVPDLIKVFYELSAKFKDIELHIAGDGEEMPICKELVKKYKLEDKVLFYGAVSHEKVKELLSQSDIFVLNSRTDAKGDMEGTPVTILEAMYMAKAVVSTIHAGIPYVIDHGKNGLLAREYSNSELKENIEKLITNPEQRNKLANEAKKTIEESFTTKVMQQKLQKVFDSL